MTNGLFKALICNMVVGKARSVNAAVMLNKPSQFYTTHITLTKFYFTYFPGIILLPFSYTLHKLNLYTLHNTSQNGKPVHDSLNTKPICTRTLKSNLKSVKFNTNLTLQSVADFFI